MPYVGVPWITGIFLEAGKHTPEMREALAISDELIAELFAADEILIGTPMYNFTVPANLKAWIDLVVRPRVTHSGPPERKGLVVGKTCTVIIASGGVYDEGLPAAASDYESGYLKRILGFIGITEVEVIRAGGTAAVAFGSTTVEELVAQFRPAVLAAARCVGTRRRRGTRKPTHDDEAVMNGAPDGFLSPTVRKSCVGTGYPWCLE